MLANPAMFGERAGNSCRDATAGMAWLAIGREFKRSDERNREKLNSHPRS